MADFEDPLVVNGSLIRAAYKLMLHREPDSPGAVDRAVAYFKTIEQIEQTLRNSAEWRAKQIQNFLQASSQKIVRFYTKKGFAMFLDLTDTSVSGQIWFGDDFEPHVEALLHQHLEWADAFVDVGANVGWFTMIVAHKMRALRTTGIVHAIEPNPRLAGVLCATIVDAALSERVMVHALAASDEMALVDLWAPAGHAASAKILHPRWRNRAQGGFDEGGGPDDGAGSDDGTAEADDAGTGGWSAHRQIGMHARLIRVPAAPLDALLEHRSRRIGLIKMDVEGHEPRVLDGARKILAQDRPKLVIEVNPPSLELSSGIGLKAFMAQLWALNYAICDPDDATQRLDADGVAARLGKKGYHDFLALPED